ncbi:ThiF family adenylyltransferase [Actinoplanes sp. NPDC051346]|uniref:HesA/MoeB/ThiF family protein n=1 Tax=Actinoplanes sp. NPDC051346 TaxID=3155048 RepID=UPI00342E56C1
MYLPRIKSVFPPVPLGDGRVRLGADFGIASEIADENGEVWLLLNLMDGTRTRPRLAADVHERFPAATREEVDNAIDTLIDMGFVEDAASPLPAALSVAERERYRRNLEFFSFFHRPPLTPGDFQLRLRDARVTVLGVGGFGSYVALSLAAVGVGHLTLVDHDRVELANLNRQILYTDTDVGRLKVEAAAEHLAAVNPHVDVAVRAEMVDGVAAARRCMSDRDLLVCAADRPRLRIYHWLNDAALAERVAWIRGGNDGLTVNLFLHVPYRTACFACVEREAAESRPEYLPTVNHMVNVIGDRTVNPCTAPMAGMIGSVAALEAVKFLNGMADPLIAGRKLIVDMQRMETEFAEGKRLDDCPKCGSGVTGDVLVA